MVNGDQRKIGGKGERFCISDPNEQGSGQSWAAGNSDGVEVGEGDAGLGKRSADDRNDGAQMLARGQLGDDSAVAGMGGDLRSNDGGESVGAALNDGCSGLVAGGFDGED